MWALRILTGEQAGSIFPLKSGKNLIGRAPQCHIRLNNAGISKIHTEIHVYDDKLILVDQNSRNGTYLNGTRVQNSVIRAGDKIAVHNIIFDVLPASQVKTTTPARSTQYVPQPLHAQSPEPYQPVNYANNTPNYQPPTEQPQGFQPVNQEQMLEPNSAKALLYNAKIYFENVVMPGAYKLLDLTEFKFVLAGFIGAFVLLVTILSTIPMMQITKATIQQESHRRALSIARNLANNSRSAFIEGNESTISTREASLEEGVTNALIISIDGSVIAPADKVGKYDSNPFMTEARKKQSEHVNQINSSTVGASVPISFYDSNTGGYRIKAFAIVIYNIGSLALDEGSTVSLFLQTLIIAILLGGILFYFLYRLIEYPLIVLNQELDAALKEGRDHAKIKFTYPALQKLSENISSALGRIVHGAQESNSQQLSATKDQEAGNLLLLIGYPALALNRDGIIIGANTAFENLTGISSSGLQNQSLTYIPDQAFQLSVKDLTERSAEKPNDLISNPLAFSGDNYLINCQAITNKAGDIDYFIVTISPGAGG